MKNATASYERHFRISAAFPFLIKYYLLVPDGYNSSQSYPLVLVLHGANRTSFPGAVLAQPAMRQKYPAFVVVPIAPIKSYWASPSGEERMGGLFPALSHAIGVVKDVQREYKIDPARVYVTGNSMGGFGTFAAAAKYPKMFAAAVPTCGGWTTRDAAKMSGVPIWAFHGARDDMIPVSYTRDTVAAIKARGGNVEYTEYPGEGHACDMKAYIDYALWDWMFAQRK